MNDIRVFAGAETYADLLNPENIQLEAVQMSSSVNPFSGKMQVFAITRFRGSIKSIPAFELVLQAESEGSLYGRRRVIVPSSGNFAMEVAWYVPWNLEVLAVVPPIPLPRS